MVCVLLSVGSGLTRVQGLLPPCCGWGRSPLSLGFSFLSSLCSLLLCFPSASLFIPPCHSSISFLLCPSPIRILEGRSSGGRMDGWVRGGTCMSRGIKTGFTHFSKEFSDHGCNTGPHCPPPPRGAKGHVPLRRVSCLPTSPPSIYSW